MNLTVNYDAVKDNSMKTGEYEVIVSEYKGLVTTQWGNERYEIVLTVRNDINQPAQNALVFLSYTPEFLEQNDWAWNTPSKALALPNGQTYNSYDDIFKAWVGRPAKVKIEVTTTEKNGQTYTNKKVKYWNPTQYTNVQHVAKNTQQQQPMGQPVQQAPMGQQSLAGTGNVQSQVDDLPFLQGGDMNAPF